MSQHRFVAPPELCAAPGCVNHRWWGGSLAYGWGLCLDCATKIAAAVERWAPRDAVPTPRTANRGSQGRIYYLISDGLLKIGFARNLTKRLLAYPPSAQLLGSHAGSWEDEQQLHARFSAYRASGREWYRPREEILHHIEASIDRGSGGLATGTRQPPGYPQPVQRRARHRR